MQIFHPQTLDEAETATLRQTAGVVYAAELFRKRQTGEMLDALSQSFNAMVAEIPPHHPYCTHQQLVMETMMDASAALADLCTTLTLKHAFMAASTYTPEAALKNISEERALYLKMAGNMIATTADLIADGWEGHEAEQAIRFVQDQGDRLGETPGQIMVPSSRDRRLALLHDMNVAIATAYGRTQSLCVSELKADLGFYASVYGTGTRPLTDMNGYDLVSRSKYTGKALRAHIGTIGLHQHYHGLAVLEAQQLQEAMRPNLN